MGFYDVLDWFAGGPDGYMTLVHCMNHDTFWIALTVILDLSIALGYVLIAIHWWRNQQPLRPSPAQSALRTMKNIFVYCGICGYIFIPIKMFWPAWRLYDGFLAVLAFYTWRYALRSRDLNVVYKQLGRADQLTRELEQAREESRRKSFFLNAISHDLKTPLNGLMLQAELAELNLSSNDPEAAREALAEIRSCARTTADLLNSFMEIGRLDWSDSSSMPTSVDLGELARGILTRHRAAAEQKGLDLRCRVPSRLIVATERVKVERILSNLIDNAIKFTQTGFVELVVETRATHVAIHVVDTGVGIAAKDQTAIFSDFYQVHNSERDSRKGFGLGLAIAQRLAQQLGGELSLESAPGRGCRFTFILHSAPLEPRGGTAAGGASGPGPTVTGTAAPALG